MEGTTYLERPAPAVYLDSRPTEGKVRSKTVERKPMRISAINRNLDSQPMEGTTYLERPAPAVYLDSWPMEAKVRSKQREWKPENVTLMPTPMTAPAWLWIESPRSSRRKDGRKIEMTRPENAPTMEDPIVRQKKRPESLTPKSTPTTSLTWPCVDSPRSPTVEYDSVNRMKDGRIIEMTRPENAPPTEDPVVTQKKMPENSSPMSTPMTSLTWPCVDSPRSPTVEYDSVNRMKDGCKIEMTRPENVPPMEDPIVIQKKRPENLTPKSTPTTSLTWPCVDSPRLPMGKHEIVVRMKDNRGKKISEAESGPPTQDSNWSMKYWEDRICHPLIYVGDFPYNVLKTTSHNPEVAGVRHEADRMFTSTGRTATRTGGWI